MRGKYGSEGDYVMNRPLHGPQNPTPVDHATDTYDTIDWLVKNVPESNGKVGILGISYDGFTPLMALVNPHPALKVSVPMNPMVDGWMGDDWFHNGAFRQQGMSYIFEQEATRKNDVKWWRGHYDDYDLFLDAVSAGELGKRHGLEQVGFWRKILEHPSYDAFWRDQAMDKILAGQPLKVPVMLVRQPLGPGGHLRRDRRLQGDQAEGHGQRQGLPRHGAVAPRPGDRRRQLARGDQVQQRHGADVPPGDPAAVPRPVPEGRRAEGRRLAGDRVRDRDEHVAPPDGLALRLRERLHGEGDAALSRPRRRSSPSRRLRAPARRSPSTSPIRPGPRPTVPGPSTNSGTDWAKWLSNDQREASGRTDVAVFTSDVLTAPVKISGQPIANLIASTSGTDSDWVVKVIDVYPPEVAGDAGMGGYQLMISADIFRGRYRESLETAKADRARTRRCCTGSSCRPRTTSSVPGHRIMVQVQSSWFPLYDRNPQTFVPNIFWAKPEDYKAATQRVYHAPDHASFIELPLVTAP